MIRGINSSGPYITVHSNMSGPYISPGAQSAGMVRWNSSSSSMEVYDGNTWMALGAWADITLNPEVVEIIEWAKRKRVEERRIDELAAKHPGIQDLKEKLDIMIALVNKEKQV
jgi:hypothetical protein